jgi:hypothetical protein
MDLFEAEIQVDNPFCFLSCQNIFLIDIKCHSCILLLLQLYDMI